MSTMKFLYRRVLFTKKNPNKTKSSRGVKYNKYIKPLLARLKAMPTTGEGVVVLPQASNALVEMLALRIASFQAGNTGVRNEIVGICDELLRQGVIDTDSYLSLIHISEPTRLLSISYAVFCLK